MASNALAYAQRAPFLRPALINGIAGVVVAFPAVEHYEPLIGI